MSVEAVQTQIDLISQDIERQEDVLKRLKRSKSLLQRQLNSLRDPIARLPLEISSEIFVQCLPPRPGPTSIYEPLRAPMLLLNICNTWTDIALCSPALWTKIDFDLPCSEGFPQLLARWLDRSGGHRLHVNVTGSLNPAVSSIIWSHSSHLERLELWAENSEGPDREVVVPSYRDPSGGTLLWESFSCLKYLSIHGRPDLAFSKLAVLQLLRLCPNLVAVDFEDFQLVPDWHGMGTSETREDIILLSLERLYLNRSSLDPFPDHSILRYISAPNLQSLGLSIPQETEDDDADTISFLKRSSPQMLFIGDAGNFDAFDGMLPLVPSVTDLQLNYPGRDFMRDFISALARSPRDVLPSLQSLDILEAQAVPVPWDAILGVLSARRTQMRSIRIAYDEDLDLYENAPPEILASLRDLFADGMDISIFANGRSILELD